MICFLRTSHIVEKKSVGADFRHKMHATMIWFLNTYYIVENTALKLIWTSVFVFFVLS